MKVREALGEIEDFRIDRCKKYELVDIFMLVLFGFLYGYEDIENIAEWAAAAEPSIKNLFNFDGDTPSADTIHRVFRHTNPKKLEKAFAKWTHGIYENLDIDKDGVFVAIDGKTIRGSNNESGGKGIHIVSAWADELDLVLGQVKTDEKSNEITAIPELLELMDLKGLILTIDAMGCQKKICEKIEEKESDYVISLKGNQGTLYESVREFFSMDERHLDKHGVRSAGRETCKDHGRIEVRECFVCSDLAWLEGGGDWPKLQSVAMSAERRTVNGRVSEDRRYFISSLKNPEAIKKAIRKHWGIENRLHWCLDMSFKAVLRML